MDDKNVMENILLLEKGRLRPVCTRRDRVQHQQRAPDVQSCTERFPRHAGYPVRQNGGKGLVSHRPCRDDKGTGGQEEVPVDAGLTQTQKSCRVFAAAFFGAVLDISYRA